MIKLFEDERQNEIANYITDGMIIAWLAFEAQIPEIWYVCRKQGLSQDIKFAEFEEVFLLIAENY